MISKFLHFIIVYISLERCRGCRAIVNNRCLAGVPEAICISCWRSLSSYRILTDSNDSNDSNVPRTGYTIPIVSGGVHTGLLRKLIIKLKQKEDPLLGSDLVQFALKSYRLHLESIRCRDSDSAQSIRNQHYDPLCILESGDSLVVPVPLHKNRLRNRGFNQSEVLAKAVSTALKIRSETRAIKRVKDTRSQRGLTREKRAVNISGVFCARTDLVADRDIILIDDVRTSGATMQEAAHELLHAGARNVVGFCIANAPLYKEHFR